ncbi:MAG: hypothetical protein DA328_04485 [Nitrososphaeraceae archaeon]|nr:hypothetical protein [Nitrososphaeraceae archaeon]
MAKKKKSNGGMGIGIWIFAGFIALILIVFVSKMFRNPTPTPPPTGAPAQNSDLFGVAAIINAFGSWDWLPDLFKKKDNTETPEPTPP